MNLSGDIEYQNSYFQNLSGLGIFDFQVGHIFYDYDREITYLVEARSNGSIITILQFDKNYNLIGQLNSSTDFIGDVRACARYSRFYLNSDGTEILVQAQYQGEDVEGKLGYITIDFDNFSNSTIYLSPTYSGIGSTNGSLVFEKIGNIVYVVSERGNFLKVDITDGSVSTSPNISSLSKMGWYNDRTENKLYLLVRRNTTEIYMIEFDYINDVVSNTSSNFIDVGTFDDPSKFGAIQLLQYNSNTKWFEIAFAQNQNSYFEIGWFDKNLNLISGLVKHNAAFSTASNIGYRRNLLIRAKNNDIIWIVSWDNFRTTLPLQSTTSTPILSGATSSNEQVDTSIPIRNTSSPHIIEIDTELSGVSSNTQFQTTGAVGQYDIYYDNGQGTNGWIYNLNSEQTIDLPQAGIYDISIYNVNGFQGLQFNNGGDKDKLLKVKAWGNIVYNGYTTFLGCSNLTEVITKDCFKMIGSMQYTFQICTSLHTFDVPEVIPNGQMYNTFNGCVVLDTVNFKGFKTSNVGGMTNVFNNTLLKVIDASYWDTSNLTSLAYGSLTGNNNTYVEELDTTGWDTRKLSNLRNAFLGCSNLIIKGIEFWNTSNLNNCIYAFQSVGKTNPNFEKLDISKWDMSNVTTVNRMFENSPAPQVDISNWDIRNVTDMGRFLANISSDSYTKCLINWSQLPLQSNVPLDMGGTQYDASAQSAKDYIINTFGWTINDGGQI